MYHNFVLDYIIYLFFCYDYISLLNSQIIASFYIHWSLLFLFYCLFVLIDFSLILYFLSQVFQRVVKYDDEYEKSMERHLLALLTTEIAQLIDFHF